MILTFTHFFQAQKFYKEFCISFVASTGRPPTSHYSFLKRLGWTTMLLKYLSNVSSSWRTNKQTLRQWNTLQTQNTLNSKEYLEVNWWIIVTWTTHTNSSAANCCKKRRQSVRCSWLGVKPTRTVWKVCGLEAVRRCYTNGGGDCYAEL